MKVRLVWVPLDCDRCNALLPGNLRSVWLTKEAAEGEAYRINRTEGRRGAAVYAFVEEEDVQE